MIEKNGKHLPIGTVVLLKNAKKKIMITGFLSVSPETGKKVFDYSGCPYPEGFLDYNKVCVFNHSQIDKVFFNGYINEEELIFKKKLDEQMSKVDLKELEKED